jgi:hypothetical protein
MVGRKTLELYRLQKQVLILESNLHRLALRTEWNNLRSATAWMDEAAGIGRKVSPWLFLLAPVAGVFASRALGHRRGSWRLLLALARWIPRAFSWWKSFAGKPPANEANAKHPTPTP